MGESTLKGVFTEIFSDKEKLFSPIVEEYIDISKTNTDFLLEKEFVARYAGHYAVGMMFHFVDGYEEGVIKGVIWPAEGAKKAAY